MQKIKTEPEKTVLVITTGLVFIYLITSWKWSVYFAFFVGFAGIISGYLAQKIDFVWTKLGWMLGLIIPNIILSIIFFVFLFPISYLAKIFGNKDPLQLKNNKESYFTNSEKDFLKSSFEKPW